jgi:hypothetical protein
MCKKTASLWIGGNNLAVLTMKDHTRRDVVDDRLQVAADSQPDAVTSASIAIYPVKTPASFLSGRISISSQYF